LKITFVFAFLPAKDAHPTGLMAPSLHFLQLSLQLSYPLIGKCPLKVIDGLWGWQESSGCVQAQNNMNPLFYKQPLKQPEGNGQIERLQYCVFVLLKAVAFEGSVTASALIQLRSG
jgi:hypothetical protein